MHTRKAILIKKEHRLFMLLRRGMTACIIISSEKITICSNYIFFFFEVKKQCKVQGPPRKQYYMK